MSEQFGKWFQERRIRAGYESLGEISKLSGISVATLSRIESGVQHPTPATLGKVALVFPNTTYTDLMVAAGYLQKATGCEVATARGPSMNNPEVEIHAILAVIETIGDLAAGIEPPATRALGLGRIKDLLTLAADCVGLIGSRTNDPTEARFTAMVIKAAIDHSQPPGSGDPTGTRR